MGTKYPPEVINAAKELYFKNYGYDRVVKALKEGGIADLDKNTVFKWAKKGKWAFYRKKVDEKASERLVTTLADLNKQHFKTAQKFIDAAVVRLDKKELKVDGSDAERMMKIQRLIFGEATERVEGFSWAVAYDKLKQEKQNETKAKEAKC